MHLRGQEPAYNPRDPAWLYSAADSHHTCWCSSNQRHALVAVPRCARDRALRRNVTVCWDHCCCTQERPLWSRVPAIAQDSPRDRLKQPHGSLASRRSPERLRLRRVLEALPRISHDRAERQNEALVSYRKKIIEIRIEKRKKKEKPHQSAWYPAGGIRFSLIWVA